MLFIILRRILQAVLVLLLVALVSFLIFRYVGNPVDNILGQEATLAQRAALEDALGLNQPIYVQYFDFLWSAVRFEFGNSYRGALPVAELIGSRLPATIELAVTSAVLGVFFGVIFGIYTAINRGSFISNFILSTSLIGVSLPTFLIGVLLIWIFSVELNWLPSFGRGEVVDLGWWTTGFLTISGIKSLVLPSITLGLYQMTLVMRLTRAEMLEVLKQDYIKLAYSLGLTNKKIYFFHALPNILIPVITIAGLQLGSVIAFAIITETVFQWPGVGLLFINAVYYVDIPVMSAYLLLVGFAFVIINLFVDLTYLLIDPRLRDSQLKSEI